MPAPSFTAFAIAAGLLILGADNGVAAENNRAAQLAALCASCHRLDGGGKAIPSIIGMGKDEFAGAMAAYKSGARANSVMHAVALSLSDAEVATLAEYLAAQPKQSKRR